MRSLAVIVLLAVACEARAQVVTFDGQGPWEVWNGNGEVIPHSGGSLDLSTIDTGNPWNAEIYIRVWNPTFSEFETQRSYYWNYGPQAGNGLWFDNGSGDYVTAGGGGGGEGGGGGGGEGGGWPAGVARFLDVAASLAMLTLLFQFVMPIFLAVSVGLLCMYFVYRVIVSFVAG